MILACDEIVTILTLEMNHMDEFFRSFFLLCFCFGISFLDLYTSQQKKRYKDFLGYICMLKPKQLFIIIYVNVCVKRVYPHKANNNILFRYENFSKSQSPVP